MLYSTILSHNVVLDELFKMRQDQEGMDFLDSLKSKDVMSNASTYAIIMSYLVDQGNIDHKLFLFNHVDEICAPNTTLCPIFC